MAIKVAINGFGRIGRLAFRQIVTDKNFEVVAINDLTDAEQLAYLLKYDTAQRGFMPNEVSFEKESNSLIVKGVKYPVLAERDPQVLPWGNLDVDVVLECTGFFTKVEDAKKHIKAGAKKVVISAPASGDCKTVVYNVNHEVLDGSEEVISGASCTTNCLAPVAKVLDDNFGIVKGFMNTVHSYTADQRLMDGPHPKGIMARRGRAAAENIVPASTGAAKAISLVLPQLKGKLDGDALRVPTLTGSIVVFTVELAKKTTLAEIDAAFKAADSETLKYETDPIVSADIIGSTHGSIYDSHLTQLLEVDGKQLVKVLAWYDNENSYVSQLVRTLKHFGQLIK